uniref:Tetraspanin n=1 Tax=Plectus sambesii TaxID=2011161 RepID=A0A914W7P9_9BILA
MRFAEANKLMILFSSMFLVVFYLIELTSFESKVMLSNFRDETERQTKHQDNLFEMHIDRILSHRKHVRSLGVLFACCLILSLASAIGWILFNKWELNPEFKQRMRRRLRLVLFVCYLIVSALQAVIIVQAINAYIFSSSDELRKEIVNLLEFASDKNPYGLKLFEEKFNCCGTVSLENRKVMGTTLCGNKTEICTNVVLTTIQSTMLTVLAIVYTAGTLLGLRFCALRSACKARVEPFQSRVRQGGSIAMSLVTRR